MCFTVKGEGKKTVLTNLIFQLAEGWRKHKDINTAWKVLTQSERGKKWSWHCFFSWNGVALYAPGKSKSLLLRTIVRNIYYCKLPVRRHGSTLSAIYKDWRYSGRIYRIDKL